MKKKEKTWLYFLKLKILFVFVLTYQKNGIKIRYVKQIYKTK